MLNNKIKVFVTCLIIGNVATAAPPIAVTKEQAAQALNGLSVPFEENRGQADAKVAFQAKTLAGPLFVTKTGELVWNVGWGERREPQHAKPNESQQVGSNVGVRVAHPNLHKADFVGPPAPTYSVVEKFIGGTPKPAGAVPSATQVNYFHGNDKSKWQNSVPTWNQVSLGEVWPGIDVKLAARGNNVEKLFTVAPGADVSKIAIAVKGGEVSVAKDGGLNVGWGEQREPQPIGKNVGVRSSPQPTLLAFTAPVAYQFIHGQRKPVTVAYRLAAANQF